MTQQRSMFGGQGGIFGRPLKLTPQTSPLGQPQGVLPAGPAPVQKPSVQPAQAPQGQALPFKSATPAPAPSASFNSKRVPMGNPGDCPVCH